MKPTNKISGSQWTELTAQQLVRYEALFKLLDDIQILEDIAEISRCIATQWKYFANVTRWRMVITKNKSYQIIDGYRGEAHLSDVQSLSPWDDYHWKLNRPRLIRAEEQREGPAPPEHLIGKSITEIKILPFARLGKCIGLLSAAARHEPFSELDNKFIRLFGSHFADRISGIILQQQAIEALISKATHDELTGLLNRGTIIERLNSQLALSRRTGQPLSVILADIDFFKAINDTHGHLAGDVVLHEGALRMQAQVRGGESLGRYGGEEFLVVLYPCDEERVAIVAERFRRAMAETAFTINEVSPSDLKVTISLGTSSTEKQEGIGIQDLLKQVDNALYCSKANGRNNVTPADIPHN
ncbi:MAG: sensor domain-containing diguanylate cyclase [Candidatus Thiodiazotropha sp. (ex Notomyrtea botanica)]|nr:sensor domain-containing diguanylate cyclase [Candidatus Thiodiazotropha sp. (ex Notomyrtea botanica)]